MHKKLFFSLLLLLLAAPFAQGQGYTSFFAAADSLTWYYSGCDEGCATAIFVARPDTVQPGPLVKAYYAINDVYPALTALLGYMREDTAARKVYYHDAGLTGGDTTEFLLYDFSLQTGGQH